MGRKANQVGLNQQLQRWLGIHLPRSAPIDLAGDRRPPVSSTARPRACAVGTKQGESVLDEARCQACAPGIELIRATGEDG